MKLGLVFSELTYGSEHAQLDTNYEHSQKLRKNYVQLILSIILPNQNQKSKSILNYPHSTFKTDFCLLFFTVTGLIVMTIFDALPYSVCVEVFGPERTIETSTVLLIANGLGLILGSLFGKLRKFDDTKNSLTRIRFEGSRLPALQSTMVHCACW